MAGGDCKAGKLCKPAPWLHFGYISRASKSLQGLRQSLAEVPNDAAPVRLRPGPVNLRGTLRMQSCAIPNLL